MFGRRAPRACVDGADRGSQKRALCRGHLGHALDSGELALESVQANAPDLILLDIRMPGLDGFEVCRRLKRAPETHNVPVIFLTGAKELDERLEGLRLGAVDFISKPVCNEELLARVKTHVELGRLRAELMDLIVRGALRDPGVADAYFTEVVLTADLRHAPPGRRTSGAHRLGRRRAWP